MTQSGGEEPEQLIARTWVATSRTLLRYTDKHKMPAEPSTTEIADHYHAYEQKLGRGAFVGSYSEMHTGCICRMALTKQLWGLLLPYQASIIKRR